MTYRIEKRVEPERHTAVAKGKASFEELKTEIQRLIDLVYDSIKDIDVGQTGQNIVLYGEHLDEMEIEVGVEVPAPIQSQGPVVASSLPAGTVAKTTHVGPYSDVHKAHLAIKEWSDENGRHLAGPNWEIYGDWNDDESKLETDVYYLLR
jgi:effector-binding domain-containing protein